MKIWSIVFALSLGLGSHAFAQENPTTFTGSWTATVGPSEVLRGTWSAATSPRTPNTADGGWTLTSESGDLQLQGTWSARKTGQVWQGTWTARTINGAALSGTWGCDSANQDAKSFAELLRNTAIKQVSGWWRAGRYKGDWWLQSSPQSARKP